MRDDDRQRPGRVRSPAALDRPVVAVFGCDDPRGRYRVFDEPIAVVSATTPAEVVPALLEIEKAVEDGLHAAGYIAYDAAAGLDEAFVMRESRLESLLAFGLFRDSRLVDSDEAAAASPTLVDRLGDQRVEWTPESSYEQYMTAVSSIRHHLARGDTYQVNFTFKMRGHLTNSAVNELVGKVLRRNNPNACFMQFGDLVLVSMSPELFFELDGSSLRSRPMKGTAARGLTSSQDSKRATSLAAAEKDRAENLMIVDMIRNDMGRIADPGSVTVPSLFDVERHPTVLQMTSTVECTTTAGFTDIIRALFPCASVTGAPKINTVAIIGRLEAGPRGVYTGTIGYLLPRRRASFNVAIRTVELDAVSGRAEYGVGSGVVWDSTTEGEYRECLLKARILTEAEPSFELLETMLWEADGGYFLLHGHLDRMALSAEYFGFPMEREAILRKLGAIEASMPGTARRIRLLLARDGVLRVETKSAGSRSAGHPMTVRFAKRPVDSSDVFLYHKTTNRAIYDDAKRGQDVDDVLMYNERGELTESTTANVVVRRGSEMLTPRVDSGLLAGVMRQHLLQTNQIKESTVLVDELTEADELFLINSVRKWMPIVVDRGG